jgi:hypothetical protein
MTHADDIDEFYEEISDDWDETNILYKTGLENKITDSSRGFYSVYFSKQGDGMSISDISHVGVKNAITVFATVGDYIIKRFRGKKGYVLHFTSDNNEPSRVKLYNRLIKFLSAKLSLKSMVYRIQSKKFKRLHYQWIKIYSSLMIWLMLILQKLAIVYISGLNAEVLTLKQVKNLAVG